MAIQVTIGDFSRMSHLSVKAVRYYHRVGLLEPAEVDPQTGYRYYATDQLSTAQAIRRFRDLEMPVDEVRAVLVAPDPSTRSALIAMHLDRLHRQLEQTQAAVASLQRILEHPMTSATISHRSVQATPAIAITDTVGVDDLAAWWSEAFTELHGTMARWGLRPSGPPGGLYAQQLFEDGRGGATVFMPVDDAPGDLGRARRMTVPAADLALVVHQGPHDDIDLSYGALGAYVVGRGIGTDEPVREYYLAAGSDPSDMSTWTTEIAWPVRGVGAADPRP